MIQEKEIRDKFVCPKCGAGLGKPCRTHTGNFLSYVHIGRWNLANRQVSPPRPPGISPDEFLRIHEAGSES